uniref:Putative DNA polymerase n=1 Tax=viral metagenome TaxID=1070528 RepID=A0A6H1ZPF7_9ZZZZ
MKPDVCKPCPLYDAPYVPPEGNEDADVFGIGEAPGEQEVKEERPFYGRSGKVLRNLLSHYGFKNPYLTNTIKCRPPENRAPTAEEIRCCWHFLSEELKRFPTIPIIALGRFALRALHPHLQIKKTHGTKAQSVQGYPFYIMYHPAAGLHNPNLRRVIEQDWERCFGSIGGSPKRNVPPLPPALAIDTETTSKNPHEAEVLAIGRYGDTHGVEIVFHNAKYDLTVLKQPSPTILYDTMYMAYHAGEDELSLEGLCGRRLGIPTPSTKELIGLWGSMGEVPQKLLQSHVLHHAQNTYKLWENLWTEPSSHTRAIRLDMDLLPILVDMEKRGVATDQRVFQELSEKMEEQTATLQATTPEVNFRSPPQLSKFLFETLGLPPGRECSKAGYYSTDDDELVRLKGLHPFIDILLEYRGGHKLLSTYITPFLGVEVVRPSFAVLTVTGRLNCSRPNLQNQPPSIRRAYRARGNKVLLAADLNQLELRVLAMLSLDPAMLRLYRSNGDLHTHTESKLKMVRKLAKTFNFASVYGSTDSGLSRETGVPLSVVKSIRKEWNTTYSGAHSWSEETKKFAREEGYVETVLGRRRYLAESQSRSKKHQYNGDTKAVNTPVQGTGAEHVKLMMLELRDLPMVIQVHDELVFECERSEIRGIMDRVNQASDRANEILWGDSLIPFTSKFEVGKNWGEMVEIA